MAPTAAPAAPVTPTGFDLYDPDKDPRVAASNARTEEGLAALAATRAAAENGKGTKPKGEKPAVTPQQKPAAGETRTYEHSQLDLMRAKQHGFDASECSTLEPAELKTLLQEAALAKLQVDRPSRHAAAGSTDDESGAAVAELINLNGQAMNTPATSPEPATPAAAKPDKKADLLTKLKAAVDAEVADAIVAYVDGVLGDLPSRVEKAEGQLGHVSRFVGGKMAEESDNQIDLAFEDLGDAFEPIFGQGNAKTLDRKSKAFKRRVLIVQAVKANPPKDGNVRKAIADRGRAEFGDLVEDDGEVAPAEPAPKTRPAPRPAPKRVVNGRFSEADYAEAALAAPNGRSPAPKTGKAKATETVRKMQEAGGGDEDDGLNAGDDKFL